MANVVITISLKPGTTSLYLTDSNGKQGEPEGFKTYAGRGDLIIWQLAPDSGIDALTGIQAKDGNFDIFRNSDPKCNSNVSWSGKIKDDAAGADKYNINYQIGTDAYSEDPEIIIKP
ncbi:hypothetical protein D770_03045 [Flammeovirgaceae bacterium 311]|nr:hypothetical protein D770_03045 [Flammeovirgaceae bacterium 311]